MCEVPAAICGYPIKGWRLQRVEHDDGRPFNGVPAWVVELKRERAAADYGGRTTVLARSLLGPLEAWDEAVRAAVRESEAHPPPEDEGGGPG